MLTSTGSQLTTESHVTFINVSVSFFLCRGLTAYLTNSSEKSHFLCTLQESCSPGIFDSGSHKLSPPSWVCAPSLLWELKLPQLCQVDDGFLAKQNPAKSAENRVRAPAPAPIVYPLPIFLWNAVAQNVAPYESLSETPLNQFRDSNKSRGVGHAWLRTKLCLFSGFMDQRGLNVPSCFSELVLKWLHE